MNTNWLFSIKGVNAWYLASAIALNLFWTLAVAVFISIVFLQQVEGGGQSVQIFLLAGSFLGPFLIGWLIGKMAGDGRGPTYGLYGSAGSAIVLAVTALPSGILGLMLIVAAIAGGLNGGMLSLRGR